MSKLLFISVLALLVFAQSSTDLLVGPKPLTAPKKLAYIIGLYANNTCTQKGILSLSPGFKIPKLMANFSSLPISPPFDIDCSSDGAKSFLGTHSQFGSFLVLKGGRTPASNLTIFNRGVIWGDYSTPNLVAAVVADKEDDYLYILKTQGAGQWTLTSFFHDTGEEEVLATINASRPSIPTYFTFGRASGHLVGVQRGSSSFNVDAYKTTTGNLVKTCSIPGVFNPRSGPLFDDSTKFLRVSVISAFDLSKRLVLFDLVEISNCTKILKPRFELGISPSSTIVSTTMVPEARHLIVTFKDTAGHHVMVYNLDNGNVLHKWNNIQPMPYELQGVY